MALKRLTDISTSTGVTLLDFIHIVNTGDTSQYPSGSSYKATLQQVADSFSGLFTFTGNTSGDCITDLFVSDVNSCSPLHIQNKSNGNVLIGENGGVNVGIGTSTPTSKLHIDLGSTSGTDIAIQTRGSIPFLTGDRTTFSVNNNGRLTAGNVGSPPATLGHTFAAPVGATTAFNVQSDALSQGLFFVNTNGSFSLGNGASGGGYFESNGTNTFSFYGANGGQSQKIGINVTNPNSTLEVRGSDSSPSNYGLKVQNSGGTNTLQVRNDGLVEFGDTSQPYNTWLQYTGGTLKLNYNTTSNFYWDGSQLQLTGLNGNSNSKLEFTSITARQQTLIRSYNTEKLSFATNGGNANIQLSSNGDLYIGNDTSTGVTASARLEVRGSGTTSSGYGLKVQDSSGTDNLVVRNDGKVGINTSNPNYQLEILPKDLTGTTQVVIRNTSTSPNWTPVSLSVIDGSGYGVSMSNSGNGVDAALTINSGVYSYLNHAVNGTTVAELLTAGNSLLWRLPDSFQFRRRTTNNAWLNFDSLNQRVSIGNENIGTPTIPARLGLRGDTNTSSSYSLVIQNSGGTNTFVARDDGNVGIGTSTPTSTLDINGTNGYNQLRLRTSFTPTGSTDTRGNVGDITWDDNNFYWKTSTQWLRISGQTF